MRKVTLGAISLIIASMIIGCSKEARDQYGSAGEDASKAAKKTGEAISTDAENAKVSADNTLESSKVKSALNSAAGLETKGINVDSDTKAKTITLSGSVPDEKQKAQAETVASGIAGSEFKVVNNLTVAAN
jgi:osmotically-inducible protein OsmY